MKTLALILAVSVASGCASITRGTTDSVTLTSAPSGARVTYTVADDEKHGNTPLTITAKRKHPIQFTVSKDGYQDKTGEFGVKVEGAGVAGAAGNVLLGGVIGLGVDAYTGATLGHHPKTIHVDLVPAESVEDIAEEVIGMDGDL